MNGDTKIASPIDLTRESWLDYCLQFSVLRPKKAAQELHTMQCSSGHYGSFKYTSNRHSLELFQELLEFSSTSL